MKIRKFLLMVVLLLALLIIGGLLFLFLRFPSAEPPSQISVEVTPERIQHGEYLVNHIVLCLDCHSVRNMEFFAGPIIPGTEGRGGQFEKVEGLGTIQIPNITPYALGNWSDGEIERAIISGISKDGRALFPMMPYEDYSKLTQDDLYAIIAYIRTLKPVSHNVPLSEFEFPMNLILRTIPKPAHTQTKPPENRGAYLTNVGGCLSCHTPKDDRGQPLPGMQFAGGMEFPIPDHGIVQSANITPDPETGIGKWTREEFIGKFRRFTDPASHEIEVPKGKPNTVMPWIAQSKITDEDLTAIYDYLRTFPPVKHTVETYGR